MNCFNEYEDYDGIGLAQLIADGQISAGEAAAAAQARLERWNPALNAVCLPLPEQAQAQLRQAQGAGPLAGCPVLIKDLLADIAGVPTRNGSRLFDGYVAPRDADIIQRYRQGGLIFIGKTATPELGLSPYTESEVYGLSRNPWDLTRTPGGSSGGSAAAVAAGIVPIAHGGDGGGSIRIPASNCGVFGLKPSRGRGPAGPDYSEGWQGLVCQHALTRSVRDSAAMLDLLAGGPRGGEAYYWPAPEQSFFAAHQREPGKLRVAWSKRPILGGALHPDCAAALDDALALLTELGHEVEEASPPLASPEEYNRAMLAIICGEMAGLLRDIERRTGKPARHQQLEAASWALARYGERLSAGELAWARGFAWEQARIMETFHQRYDALATPTLNQPPALVGGLGPSAAETAISRWMLGKLGWDWTLRFGQLIPATSRRLMEYLGWTIPFNMSGQPAMSVPLYWSQAGLPIGVQFVARCGDDLTLLRLARQLEQARPWAQRRPPAPPSA
ncbi:amidase [Chromobacterium sp. S0633]|uniref:amidase n=1 Tax=Chromobacterium sp. S0633 TaxID=2957805 RepID=UPI00209D09EB|nr:amidase [Chromobacterium sp. S0633]MCP1288824.1 amidase [Chromobacterium sp. S0633]